MVVKQIGPSFFGIAQLFKADLGVRDFVDTYYNQGLFTVL